MSSLHPIAGRDQTAHKINQAHSEFVASAHSAAALAVKVGELLCAAKAKGGHGKWADWVAENCDFSMGMAKRYIRLYQARDRLSQNDHGMIDMSLNAALKSIAAPTATAAKIIELNRDICCISDLSELAASGRKFGTIYADPPWQYGNQSTRAATDNHYGTMTVADIAAMPIAGLAAERAHLHLWTTNGFLFESRTIIEAWGFEYKGLHVWCKKQLGIGNYWRVSHELLMLGVRGGLTAAAKNETSWTLADRIGHSIKPDVFRSKIERLSPGPYLELFARRAAPGWVSWGNEIQRDLFTASVEVAR